MSQASDIKIIYFTAAGRPNWHVLYSHTQSNDAQLELYIRMIRDKEKNMNNILRNTCAAINPCEQY